MVHCVQQLTSLAGHQVRQRTTVCWPPLHPVPSKADKSRVLPSSYEPTVRETSTETHCRKTKRSILTRCLHHSHS